MAGDESKKRLARQGLDLLSAVQPEAVKARLREQATEAAQSAVLRGLDTVARATGHEAAGATLPARSRRENLGDLSAMVAAMDDHAAESFEARLSAAAVAVPTAVRSSPAVARPAKSRHGFPQEARQFAVLVYSCIELLEELDEHAVGARKLDPDDLSRREQMLERIAELLAPRASDALASFVQHVVHTSRRSRTGPER